MNWYEPVTGTEIKQGDIIIDCPIVPPPEEITENAIHNVIPFFYNVVVLTQSCDLENRKVKLVLLCPIFTLEEFQESNDFFKKYDEKKIEALRQNFWPGFHLLDKCTYGPYKDQFLIAEFRTVFSVPFEYLQKQIEKKGQGLRLKSPYRERLSQAFGLFIMRVAIPDDIPRFCENIFSSKIS